MNNNLKEKIAITTTRKPPSRVRQLVNELSPIIPNSFKIVRGHSNLQDLTENAFSNSCTKIILISSNHGNPATLTGYKIILDKNNIQLDWSFDWIIRNVKLNHEFGSKKVINQVDNAQISFINIFSEIKENFDNYFNFSKELKGDKENLIRLTLEYTDPGFIFFPNNESNQNISPIILMSEIILPDKTR
ncbi:MAG: putative Brix domain-containing ribosomal biogenesis protein [Candidatus Heimdallarchaeota archaeon LC_3]|nr:MAG: putative Brix domain-containing ribosomal biogenesis protein [Candidatus Heimdallarchaeota archaeon LC_3]